MSLGWLICIVALLPQSAFGVKPVVRSLSADGNKAQKQSSRFFSPDAVVRSALINAKGKIEDTPVSLADVTLDSITTELHSLEDRVEKLEEASHISQAGSSTVEGSTGYPADCDASKYFMSTPYEQTNIASSTDLADMISKCRSQYMDQGSSKNGRFGGWSQRYSNGAGWCARFTRAPTQAEWNSAGASSCAAYPGASGHCGAVCGTSFNAAATTTTTTTAPTTPCRVTVYEHWPEGMTTGIVGLETAETNWGGRFPTGASLILNGTGNHALGVLNNLTSSVKVEGPCCKAYGHTSTDCSGTDGTPICSNTTYLASMPAGLVTPASGLSKVWECGNDRAQCVKVTQTCP